MLSPDEWAMFETWIHKAIAAGVVSVITEPKAGGGLRKVLTFRDDTGKVVRMEMLDIGLKTID